MANLLNDFKRMIDISEEAELLEQIEEKTDAGEPKAADKKIDEIVAKSQEMLKKKNQEYQALLMETGKLRNEYEDYKAKTEKELKTTKQTLKQEMLANKELQQASGAEHMDEVYTSGLQRQIDLLKERNQAADDEVSTLQSKCNELELAREISEADNKAKLESMRSRMEAWKKRTEVNQEKARQEIEDLQTQGRHITSGEAESDTQLQERIETLTNEQQKSMKELEDLQWEMLQKEQSINELTQAVEERNTKLRTYEKEETSKDGKHQEVLKTLRTTIEALEHRQQQHEQEIEDTRTSQERRVEALGDQQNHKQREVHSLQTKIEDLERTVGTLTYQLETEKASVEQVMQHLDDTKDEYRRKDEAFNELYVYNEESRARLQALESQTISMQTTMECKNEDLTAADHEKRKLAERASGLAKELEEAKEEIRKKEQRCQELEWNIRNQEQTAKDLRFNMDKLKSELMMTAGGEKEAQQKMDTKEEELSYLKQRLDAADKKVLELVKQKDDVSARLRAAERSDAPERTRSHSVNPARGQRSRSIATRSGSPTVVDILKSAADTIPMKQSRHIAGGGWNTTRAMILVLITLFVLLGMYHGQASGIVTSSDQLELQKGITHLRSVVTAQEKLLRVCKEKQLV